MNSQFCNRLVNQRLGNPLRNDELQHLFSFVVTGEPWVARFRLHQKGVYGEQWYGYEELREDQKNCIEPTSEQKEMVEKFSELVGVGRVNEFAEGGNETCQASIELQDAEKKLERSGHDLLPYIQPNYFHNLHQHQVPNLDDD